MEQPRLLLISIKNLEGPGYMGRYHHLVEQLSEEFDVYIFNPRQPWKERDRDSSEWDIDKFATESWIGHPITVKDAYINELVNSPFNIYKIRKIILENDIDVVINGANIFLGVFTKLWNNNRPVIFDLSDYFHEHGSQNQGSSVPNWIQQKTSFLFKLVQERAMKSADIVTTNTTMLGDYALVVQPNNVSVLSNAVDTSLFKPTTENVRKEYGLTDCYVFGFGGTLLTSVFNFSGLFEGFQTITDELDSAKLMIIGDGDDRRKLEQQATNNSVREDVIFTGSVEYDQLPRYYSAFDVGVIPHYDTYASHVCRDLKLFEYLSCGTPTLCSPVREIMENVYPPTDNQNFISYVTFPEQFADSATEFVKSARRAEVRKEARNAVVGRYEWDIVGENLSTLIKEEILGRDI